jgi:hypothetical protein
VVAAFDPGELGIFQELLIAEEFILVVELVRDSWHEGDFAYPITAVNMKGGRGERQREREGLAGVDGGGVTRGEKRSEAAVAGAVGVAADAVSMLAWSPTATAVGREVGGSERGTDRARRTALDIAGWEDWEVSSTERAADLSLGNPIGLLGCHGRSPFA